MTSQPSPPGSLCYNCATPLAGKFCHACGQVGDDFHRSAGHLLLETIEGFTHADGRLWATLPRLIFRPAPLTRDYIAGKRAPQIPPLRLMLVVLFVVFLTGELTLKHGSIHAQPIDLSQVSQAVASHTVPMVDDRGKPVPANQLTAQDRADLDDGMKQINQFRLSVDGRLDTVPWLRDRLKNAMAAPDRVIDAMEAWGHDFAFMTLPISALLLSVIFIFRRQTLFFDHMIFSLHSLSFFGLLLTTIMIGQALIGPASWYLLWAAPIHLFFHMRGVYRTSVLSTPFYMLALFCGSFVAFLLLTLGLIMVGIISA